MEMPTQPKEDLRDLPAPSPVPSVDDYLPPRKEAGIYAMLALLFGYFGVNHFYAGNVRDGMNHFKALVAFSLFGLIPVVGWIVFVIYLISAFAANWDDAKSARDGTVKDKWGRPLV